MAFDNDYPNRKDWRRPYRKSKRFDRSCRPGRGCPWCAQNRSYRLKKEHARLDASEENFQDGYWVFWHWGTQPVTIRWAETPYDDT